MSNFLFLARIRGQQSLRRNDTSRNHTYPVDLYHPADLNVVKGSLPVLVFSHGYGDSRTNATWTTMAKHLAGNGFLVALPEYIDIWAILMDIWAILMLVYLMLQLHYQRTS